MNADDAGRSPLPEADEALLSRLGALLDDLDPVPEQLTATARAAFGLRRLEAELAELAYDSEVHEPELALRADDGPRLLTFEAPDLRVELQVDEDAAGARLLGRLEPRGPGRVQVQDATGATRIEASADAAGRFVVRRVPPGAVRLICHREGARATATGWAMLA